jgi:MoaA/NifB/PqqE/SkfB family radical SAM enzyme
MNANHIRLMNDSLKEFFEYAVRKSLGNPAMALFLLKTVIQQRQAAKRRLMWEQQGLHVPPYLIASITHRCNLKCQGCYARAHHRDESLQLSLGRWREIFAEARDLGISVIMIAGGEPFTRREFLDVTKAFPEIVFPVFTNGLLLDEGLIQALRRQKNVIPIVSIEGFEKETDERRGSGTYTGIQDIIRQFNNKGLLFGVSVTTTKENFITVTSPLFIRKLLAVGSKVFIYVEYTPIEPGTETLVLDGTQRITLCQMMRKFQTEYNGLFVSFPGDEEMYGGCLAAGRGFVHVSPDGSLEPCPFAPYSDTSVKERSLREALQSEFLKAIRQNHGNLVETAGGCALWTNREWVLSQLPRQGNTEAL